MSATIMSHEEVRRGASHEIGKTIAEANRIVPGFRVRSVVLKEGLATQHIERLTLNASLTAQVVDSRLSRGLQRGLGKLLFRNRTCADRANNAKTL